MPNVVITTVEEYQAAVMRLAVVGDNPAEGPEEDEFLAISAAMVAYETRNHPVLKREDDG